MAAYVAEHDYSDYTQAPGLIVNNASQALSLLAQAFYDYQVGFVVVLAVEAVVDRREQRGLAA